MKNTSFLVIPLAILLTGCAGGVSTTKKVKAPPPPPPLPGGIEFKVAKKSLKPQIQEASSKQVLVASNGRFVPAGYGGYVGFVMINPPEYFYDPEFSGLPKLKATARQGSNTIMRCFFKTSLTDPIPPFPLIEVGCFNQYQEWEVVAPGYFADHGFILGENAPCEPMGPGFAPAGVNYIETPTGETKIVKDVTYERVEVKSEGVVKIFDKRIQLYRWRVKK